MIELFAWVGEDETGEVGIKMVLLPFSGDRVPAVFSRRRTAELPIVLEQIQGNADALNRPMRLVRVVEDSELRVLTPNPQG